MSTKKLEYIILKGPHKGKIFFGKQIGARFEPDGIVDWQTSGGDRVWCEELKTSFLSNSFDPHGNNEAENLYVPYDQFDQKIEIGDTLYVAVDKGVVIAKVIGFGKPYHHGCGWHERQLKLQNIITGKKFSNNYPYKSIKKVS